jgi:hypothetical protein
MKPESYRDFKDSIMNNINGLGGTQAPNDGNKAAGQRTRLVVFFFERSLKALHQKNKTLISDFFVLLVNNMNKKRCLQ